MRVNFLNSLWPCRLLVCVAGVWTLTDVHQISQQADGQMVKNDVQEKTVMPTRLKVKGIIVHATTEECSEVMRGSLIGL